MVHPEFFTVNILSMADRSEHRKKLRNSVGIPELFSITELYSAVLAVLLLIAAPDNNCRKVI